ncbi:hypothetical protein HK405_011736, partial [Cladochytrium tenue]
MASSGVSASLSPSSSSPLLHPWPTTAAAVLVAAAAVVAATAAVSSLAGPRRKSHGAATRPTGTADKPSFLAGGLWSLLAWASSPPPPPRDLPAGDTATKIVWIVYSTADGSTERMARKLQAEVEAAAAEHTAACSSPRGAEPRVRLLRISELDSSQGGSSNGAAAEGGDADLLLSRVGGPTSRLVLLLPTAAGGAAPADALWFLTWLEDASVDHRVGPSALAGVRFTLLGIGDSAYPRQSFCGFAKKADRLMRGLGAATFEPVVFADVSSQ